MSSLGLKEELVTTNPQHFALESVFNSGTDFKSTVNNSSGLYVLNTSDLGSCPAMPTSGSADLTTTFDLSQFGDPLFSYESPPGVYPNISFPVALQVNQNYPDVIWRTSRVDPAANDNAGVSTPPPPPAALDLLPSPLRAMARTSGNLALQQSNIGDGSLSSSMAASEDSGTLSRSESSSSVSSPDRRKEMLYGNSLEGSLSSLQDSPVMSNDRRKYAFVPTHRSTKLSDDVLVRLEADRRGFNGRNGPTMNKITPNPFAYANDPLSSGLNIRPRWSPHDEYVSQNSVRKPTGSTNSETESNFSSVSGIEEEMQQVKKLLIPVRDCIAVDVGVQTACDCNPETNDTQVQCKMSPEHKAQETAHFNLLRENVNLAEQLNALREEMETVLAEREKLTSSLVTAEAQVQSLTCVSTNSRREKQSMEEQLRRAETEKQQWKGVIEEYQAAVEAKGQEVKALREDMATQEVLAEKLKIELQEQKVDLEGKDGAIRGLKKKIAELHVEAQVLTHDKIHLESNVKNLAADAEALHRSKEWYTEQLHAAQENRNIIHQELIELQAKHSTTVGALDQSQSELVRLRLLVSESRQKTVREKEVLMKHLENIEADMMEREAIFQQAERDKGMAEQLISARMKRMDEEQSKLTQLRLQSAEMEQQLESSVRESASKDDLISTLETDRASLSSQLMVLQRQRHEGALGVTQLREEVQTLERKVFHLTTQLRTRDERISELSSAKTTAEVALASINSEKRTIDEALKQMKDNLNKVECNFKQMRADLVAKASKLEQLTRENARLEETLQQAEGSLMHQKLTFDARTSTQTMSSDVQLDDLRKQNQELDRVLKILKHELRSHEKKVADLTDENESLRQQQRLVADKPYTNAIQRCDESMEEEIEALRNQMCESEAQFRDRKRVYESNIKVLTRKLKEVMKDTKKKEKELAALSSSAVQIPKRVVETQTDSKYVNGHSDNLEDYATLQLRLNSLEQEVLVRNQHLETSQQTILQLEKENGALKVLSESQEALRHRSMSLESALGEKENLLALVSQQTADVQRKAQEESQRAQDAIRQAQADLQKDRTLVKELRHQVFQEKRECKHLRHQMSSMKDSLSQSGQSCDSLRKEISALRQALEAGCDRERRLTCDMQGVQGEALDRTLQLKSLQVQLDEVKARDPALAQQHKALSWHLKEKSQELAALREQMRLQEERAGTEINNLRSQAKLTLAELEDLKNELITTRQEKFRLQSNVTDLKGALRSSVQAASKSLEGGDAGLGVSLPESPAPCDENLIQSLLQKSLALPESRPLNNLQACLNSLKQEMATLQKQIEEQTTNKMATSTA